MSVDIGGFVSRTLLWALAWIGNALLYFAIAMIIWFFFVLPVIVGDRNSRFGEFVTQRYETWVAYIFAALMVLAVIASVACTGISQIAIIPFPQA